MQNYIKFHNHYIDKLLYNFICDELKNENIIIDKFFWENLSDVIGDLENQRINLIEKEIFLQTEITKWQKNKKSFLIKKL